MNEVSKEFVFVLSGSGKIISTQAKIEFNQEDVIFIPAGEKYYWTGNFEIVMANHPPFTPKQYKHLF